MTNSINLVRLLPPIFAAIEAHREARKSYLAVLYSQGEISSIDEPARWETAQQQAIAACDVMDDLAVEILNTPIATLSGAVALLTYYCQVEQDSDGEGFPSALENDDVKPRGCGYEWEALMVRHVAGALERIQAA